MNKSKVERLLAEAQDLERQGLECEDLMERVRLTSHARHLRRIALETWRGEAPPAAEEPYEFTASEVARLETYRKAVQAGFYSDAI